MEIQAQAVAVVDLQDLHKVQAAVVLSLLVMY
jgi:hypothetical protein